jgi:mannose-6-phosphate isomerase-like protein (cupin superfamily)
VSFVVLVSSERSEEMRIAIIAPGAWQADNKLSRQWERSVSLLAKGLKNHGAHVAVFRGPSSPCSESYEGVNGASGVEGHVNLGELFARASEFDIIHNHNSFLPLTYAPLIETPILCAFHGRIDPESIPAYRKYNDKSFYVCASDADRSPGLYYISTIHDGLDPSAFEFGQSQEDYLLFADYIGPESGVRKAIDVAREVGSKLVMVGPVTDRDYFCSLEPLLNERITYAGDLGPNGISALMARSKAVLHMVKEESPLDLFPMEANACGAPVVAFNGGSASEIVKDGVNGYVVSSVDEAVNAVKDLREVSRKKCRLFVEEMFSYDRMVKEYLDLYEIILEKKKREDHRPWGYYKILHEVGDHKVKEIVMYPHKRLSLQRHKLRAEHWMVVTGEAEVRVGDDTVILRGGDSVDIPTGALHRIGNRGDDLMVFIEVQTGSYFGEDDIERFEDDFGRV